MTVPAGEPPSADGDPETAVPHAGQIPAPFSRGTGMLPLALALAWTTALGNTPDSGTDLGAPAS